MKPVDVQRVRLRLQPFQGCGSSHAHCAQGPDRLRFSTFAEVGEAMVRQLHQGVFIDGADNVVLIGGPGTSKTHIATALAVQKRSFSLLLSSSRAAEATTGWTLGALVVAEMIGGHHPAERGNEAALQIGKEGCDPRERLLLFGLKHVENRPDQKRMACLVPIITSFERAFGVDQDIGDVLDVAHLVNAASDLDQWIVMRRCSI